jgi:hypothetical protein
MTLTQQKYFKNIFNFILTSLIIFICLCIKNEIKEFQIEKWRLIKFENDLIIRIIYILIKFNLN